MQYFKNEQARLDWDDLRIILAVARTGSLNQAALALGSSHPTIFRRVRAIEKKLAVALFEHKRSGYVPTAAASEIIAVAQQIEEDIHRLELGIAGLDEKPTGSVRLTSPDTLMFQLLPPIFAGMQQQLPGIRLEVSTGNSMFLLEKREADIALRAGGTPPDHLIARRVCDIASCIYYPATWPKMHSSEMTLRPWVMTDATLAHLDSARWQAAQGLLEQAVFRCNSLSNVASAANAGMGMAILPCYLGDRAPALKRLGLPMEEFRSTLWILSHPDLRRVRRINACIEKLQPALAAHQQLFEGNLPAA
ncbi:LysR family transcriptional regulator [Undibacterium sp. JH2W]|uniref:LysR family transcriptional regulator n=1 Tax=Undibacterium sp. JH2W TaxID=3413037 RepID=UPI003BF3A2AE